VFALRLTARVEGQVFFLIILQVIRRKNIFSPQFFTCSALFFHDAVGPLGRFRGNKEKNINIRLALKRKNHPFFSFFSFFFKTKDHL
jgi:hypothetical protein